MRVSWLRQWHKLTSHSLRIDFADRDRLLSPLLFALTILILFSFAFGHLPVDDRQSLFLAECFLALFFAAHMVLLRLFAPDLADGAATILFLHPLAPSAWFAAKLVQTLIATTLFALPVTGLAYILIDSYLPATMITALSLFLPLSALGLGALGVLLSLLTTRSSGREVIFPLLFFPLATPVLLGGIEGCFAYLDSGLASSAVNWLGLLVCFDLIYLTLGWLLFTEACEI